MVWKSCGNFHTIKLGEITVFYAVITKRNVMELVSNKRYTTISTDNMFDIKETLRASPMKAWKAIFNTG